MPKRTLSTITQVDRNLAMTLKLYALGRFDAATAKKKGVFIVKDFIDHHCKDGVATHTIGEQYYKLHPIKEKSTAPSKIPSRK